MPQITGLTRLFDQALTQLVICERENLSQVTALSRGAVNRGVRHAESTLSYKIIMLGNWFEDHCLSFYSVCSGVQRSRIFH